MGLVNRDNMHVSVYVSIYSYSGLKQVGNTYKINSETAVLNKIFLDMDFKEFIVKSKENVTYFKNNIDKLIGTKIIINNKRELNIAESIVHKIKNNIDIEEKELELYDKLFKSVFMEDAEKFLFSKVLELEKILRKNDILRIWVFSGGGFHLYIYIDNKVKNKSSFYKNSADYISDLVMFEYKEVIDNGKKKLEKFPITYKTIDNKIMELRLYDKRCPPKLSQLARVIGTYNIKRKRFCISLTSYDLDMGIDYIKEISKIQRKDINYLGHKLLHLNDSFDTDNLMNNFCETIEINDTIKSSNIEEVIKFYGVLWRVIPPCQKQFLSKKDQDLDYETRSIIITFLYRCGLSKKDIIHVLSIILNSRKLYHCCGFIKDGYIPSFSEKVKVECQIDMIIRNDYWIGCKKMKDNGLCFKDCKFTGVLQYF